MERQDIDRRLSGALMRMVRRVEEAQEHAARQQGMHPTDFRCIGYLSHHDKPVSPRDIIAHLGLTSGAGTALLDRLESAGYVRRIPNPDDRRSVLIVLDRQQAAGPIALHERFSAWHTHATASLSHDQLLAIADYLEHIEAISAEMNLVLYEAPTPPGADN